MCTTWQLIWEGWGEIIVDLWNDWFIIDFMMNHLNSFIDSNQAVLMYNNTMISFNMLEASRRNGAERFDGCWSVWVWLAGTSTPPRLVFTIASSKKIPTTQAWRRGMPGPPSHKWDWEPYLTLREFVGHLWAGEAVCGGDVFDLCQGL